jgi:hypothetical protein
MAEMYAKAQPSADYYQLLEDAKNGKIGKDEKVYERHYLSYEEFIHIRDKYIKAYGLQATWKSNIEVLEDYLINGGTKDKYITSRTDEDGHYHPGYRGYEKVAPIATQIQEILKINEINDYVRYPKYRSPYDDKKIGNGVSQPIKDGTNLYDIRARLSNVLYALREKRPEDAKKQLLRLYKMVDAMINQGYVVE